jgi:hypothetical protein
MSQRLALVCVFAAVVTTGGPSLAVASIEPLVVVVETGRGGGVEPAEVRQAIATELRTSVRAPRDPAADETSDLMIVAVDRAEIRMSLRPRAAGVVSRVVLAPGDRKARLQSIGWLAGNLARDQVSGIVAPVPTAASVTTASVERPEVPAAAPSPATEPPRLTEDAAPAPAPALAGVIAAQPSPTVVGAGGDREPQTIA